MQQIETTFIGDIVEENGKTIKENNLKKKHNVPIGTLVEVKYHEWFGKGACQKVHARLWVVTHHRDCDGTPLYGLSKFTPTFIENHKTFFSWISDHIISGFDEISLIIIEPSQDIDKGIHALEWETE